MNIQLGSKSPELTNTQKKFKCLFFLWSHHHH